MTTYGFKDKSVAERLKRLQTIREDPKSHIGGSMLARRNVDPDRFSNVKRVMIGVISQTVTSAEFVPEETESPYMSSPHMSSPYFAGLSGMGSGEGDHTPPYWVFGKGKAIIYHSSRDEYDVSVQPRDYRVESITPVEVDVYNFTTSTITADEDPGTLTPATKFFIFIEDCWGKLWVLGPQDQVNIGLATANAFNVGPSGNATLTDMFVGDYPWTENPNIIYLNTFTQEWQEGDEGIVIRRQDSEQWEMFKPGGTSAPIVYFQLTSGKVYGQSTATARLVKPDGTLDMDFPEFIVYDDRNRFAGKVGHRGHAIKYKSPYDPEAEEVMDGYRIIEMEGPAQLLIGAIFSSYDPEATPCTLEPLNIQGSPTRNKLPESPVDVADPLGVADEGYIGQKWLLAHEQVDDKYIFIIPLQTIKHQVWRFQTTEDKSTTDDTVEAQILDDADNIIATATLKDRSPAKHFILSGSRGWCTTQGGAFSIITADSKARYVEGTLTADWPLENDNATIDDIRYWGGAPNHINPQTEGTVTVYETVPIRNRMLFEGEMVRGVLDEKWDMYLLTTPGPQYITIKGTSPGVTRDTTSFVLGSPVAVNGLLPDGEITVKNDPPINAPSGRTVYARFNITQGTSITDCWDTGDAGNFVLIYRGLADWNDSDRMTVDKHSADDPHWHRVGGCSTPE